MEKDFEKFLNRKYKMVRVENLDEMLKELGEISQSKIV